MTGIEKAIIAEREACAKLAEVYSSIHVEKRDDALAAKNMEGALTIARQAQTCDEIAAAIRARPSPEPDTGNDEVVNLARKLVEFIDNEGPPAKEWQAISDVTERLGKALAALKGSGR